VIRRSQARKADSVRRWLAEATSKGIHEAHGTRRLLVSPRVASKADPAAWETGKGSPELDAQATEVGRSVRKRSTRKISVCGPAGVEAGQEVTAAASSGATAALSMFQLGCSNPDHCSLKPSMV
jgi:dihydroorotate dehydrogenase